MWNEHDGPPVELPTREGQAHNAAHKFEFLQSADLEFVRQERGRGVGVYRKRSTGEEVFVGRTSQADAAGDDERTIELHNRTYNEAIALVEPFLSRHLTTGDERPARWTADKAKLAWACELLERVVGLREENWNAWWVLGMARRIRRRQ